MRTDHLVRALASDQAAPRPWLSGRVAAAVAAGGAVAAALLVIGLGVRPDIGAALQTWRFLLKLVVTLACAAFALWACLRLARPEVGIGTTLAGLALAPALLAVAVGYELLTVPAAEWSLRAIGSNSRVCLLAVPALSLAPLVAILVALRDGAPRSPAIAGAVAGLLAGGLGAALYATHCVDDSPLFVALWYTPTVALVALLGALAGRRVLRW